MKKSLLTTLALSAFIAANAQVQRLELYEEFTGENCGPCAATNPAITALIAANQSPNRKIVLLRYQDDIPSAPGAGSLYADNPTEVNARGTYYSVPFAPYARLDGAELPDASGGGNDGHAGLISQSIINSNYAVNSPVSITATHAYNATFDSLTINITVNAAQAFTPVGALKLQVAMIEKEIHFATPPGTNGEKDFEWVMRKMVPGATGTTMTAGAWTNGQTQSFTLKAKVPTYIKDKTQLAIIAFVQDDGDKSVKNTAFSDAVALAVADASLTSATVPNLQCVSTVTPQIVIKNTGTPTLTAATINYSIDGGANQVFNYVGSLASTATATVTLNPQSGLASGTHTLVATVVGPNGGTDVNTAPDSKTVNFTNFSTVTIAPITQIFTATTFPPAGYAINDVGGDGIKWTRKTCSGSPSGVAAAKADFWNGLAGESDDFYLPYTQLGTGSSLSFYVSNATYTSASPEPDQLDFSVSTDCGQTWTTLFSKVGSALNSAPAATSAFTPTSASQWRQETVNLSSFDGLSNLLMKFTATSGYGNNLYIDDINLSSTVGISQLKSDIASVFVYPNPTSDFTSIKVGLLKPSNVDVKVINNLGEVVYLDTKSEMQTGDNVINLNTSSFASGVYSMIISTPFGTSTQKLIINR